MMTRFRRLGRTTRTFAVAISAIALGGVMLVADGVWSKATGPQEATLSPVVVKLDRSVSTHR